jgi:hypothetical protein
VQLVPCERHGKCAGQPVAAGCELTRKGQRLRGLPAGPDPNDKATPGA